MSCNQTGDLKEALQSLFHGVIKSMPGWLWGVVAGSFPQTPRPPRLTARSPHPESDGGWCSACVWGGDLLILAASLFLLKLHEIIIEQQGHRGESIFQVPDVIKDPFLDE